MEDGYILSFKSTHDAFKSQHLLSKMKVLFIVIPTPVEISANCGLSLYIEINTIITIQTILEDIHDILYVKAIKKGSQIVPKG